MKKVILTTLLVFIALAGAITPAFADSYDMVESNYGNYINNTKYNYLDNSNIYSYKNIEKQINNIGNYSISIFNTKYYYYLNADLKTLYNNSEYRNYLTNEFGSIGIPDDSYVKYYFISTFNPNNFDNEDCFVSQELIPFICDNTGRIVDQDGKPVFHTYYTYNDFRITLMLITAANAGGGFVNADELLSGSYTTYGEIAAQGYVRGSTTVIQWNAGRINENNRQLYLTEFFKTSRAVDTVSKSTDLNSNIQKSILLDRCDFDLTNINFNWSYADFTISSNGNAIYEKSNNIYISNVVNNAGNHTYSLRIINNNETPFITFCQYINNYGIFDNTYSVININANFYYDDSININDYSESLRNINAKLTNIFLTVDDIDTLLNTNNTLNENIYNSIGTVNTNLTDIFGVLYNSNRQFIEIKDLISDLQVQEINNIYQEITNNYNIDIETNINGLIDDLKLNLNNLSIDDPKFSLTNSDSNAENKLSVFKQIGTAIIDVYDDNGLSYLYFVPTVLLIIGAVII